MGWGHKVGAQAMGEGMGEGRSGKGAGRKGKVLLSVPGNNWAKVMG